MFVPPFVYLFYLFLLYFCYKVHKCYQSIWNHPNFAFWLIQAAQLTHVVEGWLKDAQEEADKENTLK